MSEEHVRAASSPAVTPSSGVSLGLFAAIALVATVLAQALAPALRGSATGIARWIDLTSFLAACTSQLVAAGGIALSLRLLGSLLPWANLGVAFRIVIVPAALGIVALTVAAAAQPIDPELGRVVAIAAIVVLASAGPLLWTSLTTRGFGVVMLLCAAAASCDLAAYEVTRRARFAPGPSGFGSTLSALGLWLDFGAALLGFAWVANRQRSAFLKLGGAVGFAALLALIGQVGGARSPTGPLAVLHRSLAGLTDRPLIALPTALWHTLGATPILLAALMLFVPGRKAELRAAVALCLLGRTATGAPAAALLSVGAALAALGALTEAESPERGFASARAALRPR